MSCLRESCSAPKWLSNSSFLCLKARSSAINAGFSSPVAPGPIPAASSSCWRLQEGSQKQVEDYEYAERLKPARCSICLTHSIKCSGFHSCECKKHDMLGCDKGQRQTLNPDISDKNAAFIFHVEVSCPPDRDCMVV